MEVSVISAVQSIWDGFDFSYLLSILLGLIPALICITFHELSHGLAAWKLGDDTAKNMGRLTLNPIKHLDVMGLLMMMVFHVGWAKPVPVNMYKFRNPKRGMALTALAGPMSNLVLAFIFMFLYGVCFVPLCSSAVGFYVLEIFRLTAYISIGLAVFNLLPVPPLDGSKVLFSLMSDESYNKLMRYERIGVLLMVVLVSSGVLGKPLSSVIDFLYMRLLPMAQWLCDAVYYTFY